MKRKREVKDERVSFSLCRVPAWLRRRLACDSSVVYENSIVFCGDCTMTKQEAAQLARGLLKLTHKRRAMTLKAMDTDNRILVLEALYCLKADIPAGKTPNCS